MTDRRRFETLVRPHMDAAFNMAYWILRDRDDAQDAIQDAYLQAFRAFESFRGDRMRPWLLAIVRNAALKIARRRRYGERLPYEDGDTSGASDESLEPVADAPSPEALLVEAEERSQVRAAIALLPSAFREAIVLREIEGLAYDEIAEVTGVPIGTVMSRLSRARGELRKLLGHPDTRKDRCAL